MNDEDDDNFTSVTWGSASDAKQAAAASATPSTSSAPHASSSAAPASGVDLILGTQNLAADPYSRLPVDAEKGKPKWEGYLMVEVTEARKEHEGTKEQYVSYGIRAETNLRHFSLSHINTRRRFQDFVFLRENLSRDFPACVVAPLPDKYRIEYLTGDRFSAEFIERRVADLQLFLERVCRHPTLQRSHLLRSFLESTEWSVEMHMHTSSAASGSGSGAHGNSIDEGPRAPQSLLDSLSDTFLNAFAKVRKPDERFEIMRDRLEKFDEGLAGVERVISRGRVRWTGEFRSNLVSKLCSLSPPPIMPISHRLLVHSGPSALPPSSYAISSRSSSPAPSRSQSPANANRNKRWSFASLTPASAGFSTDSSLRRGSTSSLTAVTPTSSSAKTKLFAPNLGLESQDLATDYEELANAFEGLGYLESGITDPLNRFAATSNEWSRIIRTTTGQSTEDLQSHLHAILAYSASHRSVLKLRDQKQLDFEELTDYLSSVVSERDRLASLSSPYGGGHGHGGVRGAGLTGFLKDKVDSFRGIDEERTRVERMARLDGRIKELQDAVTTSHDVSQAFSDEVIKENQIFHMAKDQEMKDLIGAYTQGQVEMWKKGADLWDGLIPRLEAIKTDV